MAQSIVGNNIRALRETHGETLKQLAKALSVSVSTVSAWERGARSPHHDAIQAIASRYSVTVDRILSLDDHYIAKYKFPSSKSELKDVNSHIIKYVSTPDAMEDEEFREGYRNLQALRTTIIEDMVDPDSFIQDTEEHFRKSVAENKTVESACNWVALLFYIWIEYVYTPDDLREEFKNLPEQGIGAFTRRIMRNNNLLYTKETEKKKREFLESRLVIMKELLKIMKRSDFEEWADLADYYTAMMYIFGIVNNPNSPAENDLIGSYMMNEFMVLGNKYAKGFVESVIGTFFEEKNV